MRHPSSRPISDSLVEVARRLPKCIASAFSLSGSVLAPCPNAYCTLRSWRGAHFKSAGLLGKWGPVSRSRGSAAATARRETAASCCRASAGTATPRPRYPRTSCGRVHPAPRYICTVPFSSCVVMGGASASGRAVWFATSTCTHALDSANARQSR